MALVLLIPPLGVFIGLNHCLLDESNQGEGGRAPSSTRLPIYTDEPPTKHGQVLLLLQLLLLILLVLLLLLFLLLLLLLMLRLMPYSLAWF